MGHSVHTPEAGEAETWMLIIFRGTLRGWNERRNMTWTVGRLSNEGSSQGAVGTLVNEG